MKTYTIESIEGIGPSNSEKLEKANIRSISDLLDKCYSRTGRRDTSELTGISEAKLLDWTNMADLFRVQGVGGQFAELLKASGVDTIKELKNRNPLNLHQKMAEVNKQKKLVRQIPGLSKVKMFVMYAKTLDPVILY
jgi:nucleotidyltransferase/DNA polymerase involved in DNA repair